jgi:hypothetical protein
MYTETLDNPDFAEMAIRPIGQPLAHTSASSATGGTPLGQTAGHGPLGRAARVNIDHRAKGVFGRCTS